MSKGGGTLLAIKSEFFVEPIDLSHILDILPSVDIVGCKCLFNNFFTILVYVVYIPPNISVENFESFLNIFEQNISNKDNVLILGDFNITNFNSNIIDTKCQLMQSFLEFVNMKQFNNVENVNGRLLDLVISDLPNCNVSHDNAPFVREDTHHPALNISLVPKTINPVKFPINLNSRTYNFKKANYPALYDSLLQTDWTFLETFQDVNIACDNFYNKLYSIFDVHVPVYKNNNKKFPIWYTAEIIKNIKLRDKYRKKYKKHNDANSAEDYKRIRSIIKYQTAEAYKNYLNDVEANLSIDPKQFWSYINNKKCTTRIPGKMYYNDAEIENPQTIVNSFSHFFNSVYLPASNELPSSEIMSNLPCVHIDQLSEIDVTKAIKKLKNKMTSGHDMIPSFLVKDCSSVFVTPLLIIFNMSLRTSTFPECWKLAKVCPIYKSGNVGDIINYRGISILPNFAKVFEASVYSITYSTIKHSISTYQHGFMETVLRYLI